MKLLRLLPFLYTLSSILADTCFHEYQCIFHWLSDSSTPGRSGAITSEYSYDLRPLCTGNDRNFTFVTSEGYLWTIMYQLCGNTTWTCNPSWIHTFSHGSIIQLWGTTPGGRTTDPETGQTVDITPDCEILAHTLPEFDVIDPNNPQNGIILRQNSLPPTSSDKYGCPTDPRSGYPKEREVNIIIQCDQSMSVNDVREISFTEIKTDSGLGTCQYNFILASGAGCGVKGDPFDNFVTSTTPTGPGAPSYNFGFTILGAVLCVGLQFGFNRAYSAGYFNNIFNRFSFGSSNNKKGFLPVSQSNTGNSITNNYNSYGST
jgi:hypothetical protein